MKIFSPLKWLFPLVLLLWFVPSGCKNSPVIPDIAREQLGVGILTVNLRDLYNQPDSATGIDWQTRYARIGAWITASGKIPDVITLQETPGWWECGFVRILQNYEALDYLIDQIRMATGEQYRIAYLITAKEGGTQGEGWVFNRSAGSCLQQGGRALLYRSSRVRNVITAPATGATVAMPYSATYPFPLLYSNFMARSLECCPGVGSAGNVCRLIDGAISSNGRSCPTPEGLAWTRARVSMQGVDPQKPQLDAIFSRFELINQPGQYFHIYNIHRGTSFDPADDTDMRQSGVRGIDLFVTAMESRYTSASNLNLYPPIVVGDLNFGHDNMPPPPDEVLGNFPRFEIAMWGPENVGALFGLRSVFPAKQQPSANLQDIMPMTLSGAACYRDPATLWSDHCGLYFRVEPAH